ncbi:hypothetical protein DL93DRAFT_2166088 [Clavulina sp. PMI_390]|nr:hypothetical protein DL93DRAFT_2166088 [Clavulina sp. PMI_390]
MSTVVNKVPINVEFAELVYHSSPDRVLSFFVQSFSHLLQQRIMFTLSNLPKGLWTRSPKPFSRNFPDDILYMIISWVALNSRRDLKTLSLVNRHFFDITCGLIWDSVELAVDPQQSIKANNGKLNILLRRATQRKGLSMLAIRLQADVPEGRHRTVLRTHIQLLAREASQLRSLTLIDTSQSMDLDGIVMADFAQHHFQLVELRCKLVSSPSLRDFLISQPTIRRLSLIPASYNHDPVLAEGLPFDALPNLEAALGDLMTLQILRGGRSIRYIAVVPSLQPELLPELWNTLSTTSSRCSLEALSVVIGRGDVFREFFFHIHTYAPALRFLGLITTNQISTLWGALTPTKDDAIPLRHLVHLETIRWGHHPTVPGDVFHEPGRPVSFHRWHPARFAGAKLRHVQHESIIESVTDSEGHWEHQNLDGDPWVHSKNLLFPPRRGSKHPAEEVLDPVSLEYLKPAPYSMDLDGIVLADFAQHHFHLVELRCKLTSSPSLRDFLISQPTIQRLSLIPTHFNASPVLAEALPSDALPNLEAALADLITLQVLREGRSVRYIAVEPSLQLELLPELWNTISTTSSQCSLEALSIIIGRGDVFRDFFLHLHTHAPSLRFLGLITTNQISILWGSLTPTKDDAIPSRHLAHLEIIRWVHHPAVPGDVFHEPGRPVHFHSWNPSRYAGPMLRYVQHESVSESIKDTEGHWERRDSDGDSWAYSKKLLFPPRRDSKHPAEEVLDPVGLEYLKPAPYVLQSR